ncbi:MAG: CHRD domain-containing protein [Burkholderiales bacterium]
MQMKRYVAGLLTAAATAGMALASQAASAALITYTALLSGPAEDPPNASPGVGSTTVIVDTVAQTLNISVIFSGLVATTALGAPSGTTVAHIHCCTALPGVSNAGVATQTPTFGGFPVGVTSGTYNNIFNLTLGSSYNPAFITANGGTTALAETTLLAGLNTGSAYLNIHSTAFPGGEIRGFLQRVPEPGSLALAGLALFGLVGMRRRK